MAGITNFRKRVLDLPAFSISQYKVTNRDYLEFVSQGNPAPHFWVRKDNAWYYRGMFDLVELPLDAPVYVTQEQATAYAHSRGATLPTEGQYHRAAFGTPYGDELQTPWGHSSDSSELHGNFDFRHWDPVSVLDYPAGASAFGLQQPVGNGWEWTRTTFAPFPGFPSGSALSRLFR